MVVCHKSWEKKTESAEGAPARANGNGGAHLLEGGPVFLVRRPLSAHARALLAEVSVPAADVRPPLRLVG